MPCAGYGQFVQHLASTPGLTIRLSTAVTQIDCSGGGEVLVAAQCDSSGAVSLRAAAVVVSLPLGVLKAGAVDFVPPLATAKSEAIGRLGVGLLNKVQLEHTAPHCATLPYTRWCWLGVMDMNTLPYSSFPPTFPFARRLWSGSPRRGGRQRPTACSWSSRRRTAAGANSQRW